MLSEIARKRLRRRLSAATEDADESLQRHSALKERIVKRLQCDWHHPAKAGSRADTGSN